jgi:hypothetical protein
MIYRSRSIIGAPLQTHTCVENIFVLGAQQDKEKFRLGNESRHFLTGEGACDAWHALMGCDNSLDCAGG